MGHLINPSGFRVGYFSNWTDIWSTSNNIVYAEILHNTVSFRRVMGLFFENFITDHYSILYSHFTLENFNISKLKLKMYFYDGIVEQKLAHLAQILQRFRAKKKRAHRRLLRKFLRVKPIKSLRVGLLRFWRFYDYSLARQIVFFFIYMLNINTSRNMSRITYIGIVSYFYTVFDKKWFYMLKKDPSISVFAFIKYYLKYLINYGFDSSSANFARLHVSKYASDFSIFLKALDKTLYFWQRHQNFFNLTLLRQKISSHTKYLRFLHANYAVDRFSLQFFTAFYRLYLLSIRQSKFFRFTLSFINPIFSRISPLDTSVEFFGIENDSISAIFLARYIARKIEMRFRIKELFTPIGRELKLLRKQTPFVLGYKLQFVGRLTRRGRVRTTWLLSGSIPTSTISAQVEHSMYLGILRNGICCVRVWLYRHKSLGNYNYNFFYKVKT